ncbi:YhcN/YlaJ family sporulation lipoprotein [Calidifontibacillus erzurumensis]|uniref:YhcN/YlaJ family sporulation lipoprotein n=1 Tax=Calidifontibacillus erzurumensis TaxID=2741433 RepID=A0A8J8GH21_9BACI|nr:YhcN/YlaJ family sporulation lipoprotein [Calidifontibacillus erzurumensis]NSL53066.1 YhcN/YlaJ family sporulation lipoprotein [Calidifontibacillus erzurumensis]
MKYASIFSLLIIIFSVLSGCNEQNSKMQSNVNGPAPMGTAYIQSNINQQHADQAKEILLQKKEVKWVRAVESKNLLMVAVELKHWYTFQSKKLTKQMKKELEKQLDMKTIEVTTDHKIFIELEKLEEKIQNGDISKEKLNRELKDIRKLMKEQT